MGQRDAGKDLGTVPKTYGKDAPPSPRLRPIGSQHDPEPCCPTDSVTYTPLGSQVSEPQLTGASGFGASSLSEPLLPAPARVPPGLTRAGQRVPVVRGAGRGRGHQRSRASWPAPARRQAVLPGREQRTGRKLPGAQRGGRRGLRGAFLRGGEVRGMRPSPMGRWLPAQPLGPGLHHSPEPLRICFL